MSTIKDPLPDELVLKILQYCDGATLIRCSRTCKQWYRIAAGMSTDRSRYWYHAVKKEIEPSAISQLLLNHPVELGAKIYDHYRVHVLNAEEAAADDEDIHWPARYDPWYKLYAKWYSGTLRKEFTRHSVDGLHNNHVALMRQSGDLVISGHYNGAVSVFNCVSESLIYITTHLREVTGIALVNLTLHQSFRYGENATCNHHHIISIARNGDLRCNPIFPTNEFDRSTISMRLAAKDLYDVRIFGNQCVVQSKEAFFILKLSLPVTGDMDYRSAESLTTPLELKKMQTIIINTRTGFRGITWMNFWKNKITHIDGLTLRIDVHDSNCKDWIWDYTPEFSSTLSLLKTRQRPAISRAFLFRDKIAFFISNAGNVYVTIDLNTVQELPVLQHFTEGISAISYWGSLLAFGLNDGKIYGYSVLESSKLVPGPEPGSLDLADPVFVKHVDPNGERESIVALDVYNPGTGYCIAASTLNSLTVFRCVG